MAAIGRITITFARDDAGFYLSAADDGIGVSAAGTDDAQRLRRSMSKVLTQALAAQLGGQLRAARVC